MYCTQCGFKIEDGFKFCPECGTKVVSADSDAAEHRAKPMPPKGGYSYNPAGASNNSKMLSQVEIDRIADEIASECPAGVSANAKELSKRAGIPYSEAHDMMWNKRKQWKLDKKQGKYPNAQYCPSCGSQHIESYEELGITVTSKANVFGGMYISSSNPSTKWMRCDMCGYRWRPKKMK